MSLEWAFRMINRKLDLIIAGLKLVYQEEHHMSQQLDDLTAEVAQTTELEASAITLIQGLAAQIAAAGTDPAKLAALTASLKAKADELSVAIVANTPAAPPP